MPASSYRDFLILQTLTNFSEALRSPGRAMKSEEEEDGEGEPQAGEVGTHPTMEDLRSFVACRLPPSETRAVVRHLLRGCPDCSRETRRLWSFASESPDLSSRSVAMTPLTTAQRQLHKVEDGLETLQLTMLGIESTLPEPAAEPIKSLDVEGMDAATELRAVIGCLVKDYIGPALRDLRRALAETESEQEDSCFAESA